MKPLLFPIAEISISLDSSRQVIYASNHPAKEGDIIRFVTGVGCGLESIVRSVTQNTIILKDALNLTCSSGDIFHIFRPAVPKQVYANVAGGSTESVLVAAVPGRSIRVVGLIMGATTGAVSCVFLTKGAGAGQAISAAFTLPGNSFRDVCFNPGGWFETLSGESLACTTGATNTTRLQINYVEL